MYRKNEKTYKAQFSGKTKGSIGISLFFETTVRGINEEEATINLYERYDHIMSLKLELIHTDIEIDKLTEYLNFIKDNIS